MALAQQGQSRGVVRARAGRFQASLGPGWTMHRTVVRVGTSSVYDFVQAVGGCRTGGSPSDHDALSEARKQALATNGLNLSLIPVDQVEHLLSVMGEDPSLESTWLGNVNNWKSIAAGSPIRDRTLFRIDEADVEYISGYGQLLMRGYPLQSLDGPFVWLELIPHFRQPPDNPYAVSSLADLEIIGDWVTSCGVRLALDGSCAVVILPEREQDEPEDDAAGSTEDDADGDPGDDQVEESVEEVGEGDDVIAQEPADPPSAPKYGPLPVPILTIGHDVLYSDDENRMLVVILIPSAPQP